VQINLQRLGDEKKA
jgi:hypothetical protein